MDFGLISLNNDIIKRQAAGEIIKCNDFTVNYGLTLTEKQACELTETRFETLKSTGRIEFGGGVINKLIKAFCDSPYITCRDYADTLHGLIRIFYYYKNETEDAVSDDDLIKLMKNSFDGVCRGSLELLSGRELEKAVRNLRHGRAFDCTDADDEEDEENDDEYDGYRR